MQTMVLRTQAVRNWTIAAFAMDLVHDLDHVRRHNYSPVPVRFLGFIALVGGILAVTLVVRRNRFAVPFACFYGFASVIGLFAVHVLPHWGAISDPLTTYHVDALTWLIIGVTMGVDLTLGIVAARELISARTRGLQAPAAT
jgi:hypothetical protein